MRRVLPAAAVALLLLTGCSSPSDRDEPAHTAEPTQQAPEPEPTSDDPTPEASERTEVDWDQYPQNYQQIADEETAEKDCAALQDMFDVAPDDPDLLRYLDEALTLADCY